MADHKKFEPRLEPRLEQVSAQSPVEIAATTIVEGKRRARSEMAAKLDAVRGRVLAEVAVIRAHNAPRPSDGEAMRISKAAALALADVFQAAADKGAGGVPYQLDVAYCLGGIFGAIVRARGLSRPGTMLAVEDLAAAVGQGALRAALEQRR